MPLRTTLENFINHVDTLEAKRLQGDDLYDKEFKQLKSLTESLRTLPDFSSQNGENDINKRKNRYKDIVPYDYTRVTLSCIPGILTSDYINASYIKGASGSLAYIAAQGPLQSTVDDFWRMIWECEIQVIIMACNEVESGKHKCEKYWPSGDESRIFGTVTVRMIRIKHVCPEFVVRTLTATNQNEERTIVQFHYVSWPDHGIPDSVTPILNMVKLLRDCQASETLPVLVHCSAGCGRTGTICAIDFVWGLLRTGKLTDNFSLFQLVSNMRKQRIAMVQTKEQYILVYRAVRELFIHHLNVMDSHPYENVDFSGTPLMRLASECNFIDEEEHIKNDGTTQLSCTAMDTANCKSVDLMQEKRAGVNPGTNEQQQQTGKVQHLISTWNNGQSYEAAATADDNDEQKLRILFTDHDQNVLTDPAMDHHYENISLYSNSTNSPVPSPSDGDLQPEKAVIVRKPSIARLRAIFEKSSTTNTENSQSDSTGNEEMITPNKRTKSKKKLSSESDRGGGRLKRSLSPLKRVESVTNERYRDTALKVYSEFRQKQDVLLDSPTASISSEVPSPEFIRRHESRRNSLRRTSSSIWYDEENDVMSKSANAEMLVDKAKEKPALPVKRSKSLKITTTGFDTNKETSLSDQESKNKESVPSSMNGTEQESPKKIEIPLNEGLVKLRSSPWNPRRSHSRSMKTTESKTPTKEKKPWHFFSEKQPEVVAGFDKPAVLLVRIKSNAEEYQPPIRMTADENAQRTSSVAKIKEDKPQSVTVKKDVDFKQQNSFQTQIEESQVEDKPPPLPIKTYSPLNSPRLKHQQMQSSLVEKVKNASALATKLSGSSPSPSPPQQQQQQQQPSSSSSSSSPVVWLSIPPEKVTEISSKPKEEVKLVIPVGRKEEKVEEKMDFEDEQASLSSVDETSYQQIIQDCQEYLMSTGYTNLFPKMMENLSLIESSMEKHPRGGFVDLLPGVDDKDETRKSVVVFPVTDEDRIPDEFYLAEDVQQLMREIEKDQQESQEMKEEHAKKTTSGKMKKKDYEHLWLSRTGKREETRSDETTVVDAVPDLNAYKIVQQVLNNQTGFERKEETTTTDDSDHHFVSTVSVRSKETLPTSPPSSKDKRRKPQPLPRKKLPSKGRLENPLREIVDLDINFSSEGSVSEEDGICGNNLKNETDRTKQEEFTAGEEDKDSKNGCIYSEVTKTKKKFDSPRLLHGSKDDLDLLPSAPPRLKRQFSLQQAKTTAQVNDILHWRHTLPGRLPGDVKKVKLRNNPQWDEEWDSDEDCTPPVPEKTREAYMLPLGVNDRPKFKEQSSTSSAEKFPVNKTSKFNLLSKFGLKTENKGSESTPWNAKSQQISSEKSNWTPAEIGFPNRLPEKPKGPRNVPDSWEMEKSGRKARLPS